MTKNSPLNTKKRERERERRGREEEREQDNSVREESKRCPVGHFTLTDTPLETLAIYKSQKHKNILVICTLDVVRSAGERKRERERERE